MSRPHISHSSFSRLSFNDEGDDDGDAWAADSDDETTTNRQHTTSPGLTSFLRSQQPKLTRPMAAGGTNSRSVSTSSVQTTSSASSTGSSGSRRHAPPARPHPFPIPQAGHNQRTVSSSPALSSWTMVEGKSQSAASIKSSTSVPPAEEASSTSLAGSSPADVGSTAAEAVIKAATTGSFASSTSAHPQSASHPSIKLTRSKSRESSSFIRAMRPDLPGVVRDPFAALDALAAEADLPTPGIESPLPSPGPSSTSTSRRQSRVPREAAHFDPVTMGGDGLIMGSGAFGSSSSSLDQIEGEDQAEEEGDTTIKEASLEPLSPPASAASTYTMTPGTSRSLAPPSLPQLRRATSVRTKRRWREFLRCLQPPNSSSVDLPKLRELSWNGIPSELRPIVWPLLLGYVSPNSSVRAAALAKKRQEYRRAVTLAFGFDPFAEGEVDGPQAGEGVAGGVEEHKVPKSAPASIISTNDRPSTPQQRHPTDDLESGRRTPLSHHSSRRSGPEEKIWHQITIDVPRTNPGTPLWQRKGTQRALERLLYVWAVGHHATGYVQGMSDLATPFYEVFLSNYLRQAPEGPMFGDGDLDEPTGMDPQSFNPHVLPLSARLALEADVYHSLSSLLSGIQSNYIPHQPGILRSVRRLESLVSRIDAPLHSHLKAEGVEYMQFAFRWMNCLLMREMSTKNVVRLWDTYLAEGAEAFSDFHCYVCCVFLCKWSAELRELDFQGCIMFLQSLPTQSWSDKDAELLLSEAFVFKNLFAQTKHLND